DTAFLEGKFGQPARPLDHRPERLATLDGIVSGEADFSAHEDTALSAPLRQLLDGQQIERLQYEVSRGVPAQDGLQIDVDQLRVPRLTALAVIADQLGGTAISGVLQAAARANEVADLHTGLEWILAGHLDAPLDAHDLRRGGERRLQAQLVQQG